MTDTVPKCPDTSALFHQCRIVLVPKCPDTVRSIPDLVVSSESVILKQAGTPGKGGGDYWTIVQTPGQIVAGPGVVDVLAVAANSTVTHSTKRGRQKTNSILLQNHN